MTSDTQHSESGSSIGRRTFIKGVGASAVAGAGLTSSSGPVGDAEALPPLVIAGAYAAGTAASGITVGWSLRELEIIGADSPPEGLTLEALVQRSTDTIRARDSNDRSTFIDNKNILEGLGNVAYTDGKIAAIEELNREATQEDVQEAGLVAAREQFSTVKKNVLRSWNETVSEVDSIVQMFHAHPDLEISEPLDDLGGRGDYNSLNEYITPMEPSNSSLWSSGTSDHTVRSIIGWQVDASEEVELPNGKMVDVNQLAYEVFVESSGSNQRDRTVRLTPANQSSYPQQAPKGVRMAAPDDAESYPSVARADLWAEIWDEIEAVESEVVGGLQNWTASVYEEVQSGSIDVSDLLTPREQAELLSDDEEYPQAVADLIALNIPVDPDREATISFSDRDITISGLMAPTSPPEEGFSVGETYDPSAEPWDLYFTYDPSRGSGGWSEYEELIAEGELQFTEEPYAGVLYRVPTNLGMVEVVSDDFEEIDGGLWAADVSEQLGRTTEEWTDYQTGIDGGTVTFGSLPDEATEFDITTNQGDTETVTASDFEADGENWTVDTSLGIAEVESVTAHIDRATIEEAISIYSEDGSANYETVQIREEFTLDRLEDSDGNEVESAEFSRTEPQDDENYITQDEWDELEQQNQELIDKYEEAANSDDGLFGGGGFDFGDIGEIPVGATAAAAGVAIVVVIVGVLRQVASFYLPGR